mmetsp:Transcript_10439/g.23045  ORF Transcript_10439/g.23045 Transcript_10439/m.23045 type:complete len:209 (+) Transcript_10439:477-1103(+)
MAKEVSFLDAPFAFLGIDSKALVVQTLENQIQEFQMVFPAVREGCNIIHVALNVVQVMKQIVHLFLRNVWRLAKTLRQTLVAVESMWSGKCGEITTCLIQYKGVIMHGEIQFRQKVVALSTAKNVHYLGHGIRSSTQPFVEATEISNPADLIVLLGNDESSSNPFGSASFLNHIFINETEQFTLEESFVRMGNSVGTRLVRLGTLDQF